MSDNFPQTPGTGRNVATDEVTYSGDTADVQLMRIVCVSGSEGSKTVAEICDANGVASVIRRDLQKIAVTSSSLTTATTAYTAGDMVGAQMTFANAARVSGGGGTIVGATLISAADIIGAYDVVVSSASMTLASDNAAWAVSDADALNIIGLVQLASVWDIGNNRIAQAFGLAIPYTCAATSLFCSLITRAGHTFFGATTDLQLTLFVERN